MSDSPHVHQISVSDGGIPKRPVAQARISVQGVEGDRQRNSEIHGGPERAVCLFSLELIDALRREGHTIEPGSSGENLTLAGLRWADLGVGDRVRIGEVVELEIASFTSPCKLNAQWFQDGRYRRISQKDHPGWSRLYARVVKEGLVRAGDLVQVVRRSTSKFVEKRSWVRP